MQQVRAIETTAVDDFGPEDHAMLAHVLDIHKAIVTAPGGMIIRAEAGFDGTWRGLILITEEERSGLSQPDYIDGSVIFWNASPGADVVTVEADIRDSATWGAKIRQEEGR